MQNKQNLSQIITKYSLLCIALDICSIRPDFVIWLFIVYLIIGRTPLMLACMGDCPEALTIVQYLLDRNANVTLTDADGYTGNYDIVMLSQFSHVLIYSSRHTSFTIVI